MRDANGAVNQIGFATLKSQTLTPNPDTLYFMPFFSSKDVGPAGMDQGKDGQYYLFVTRDKMAIR